MILHILIRIFGVVIVGVLIFTALLWHNRLDKGMSAESEEIVDPLDQLAMSLAWYEDYTDEYKRKTLRAAIVFARTEKAAK